MFARFLILLSLLPFLWLGGSTDSGQLPFTGSKLVALQATPIDVRSILHSPTLRPQRGWILSSDDPDFGGLSALSAGPSGLVAVSDTGLTVRFGSDLKTARLQSLPPACVPHQLKRERDSESLVVDPATRWTWIGFEYRNLICRIAPDGSAVAFAPPAMADWPKLTGPEAMVRRVDGRFLVFDEKGRKGGSVAPLLLFDRDPVDRKAGVTKMEYRAPDQYHPSDAALLPDGRMLIVNRRHAFPLDFSAIVTLVEPFAAKPGLTVRGQPVALLAPPGVADNFEGIAVEQRAGKTFVWLVSDDNFLPEQRTYLLEFVVQQ